jgi:hypothetical protein
MARPRPPSPHVGTLDSTIRVRHSLTINCGSWDCRHRATVDLEALSARFGEVYPAARLVERAVCSECDARWPDLSLTVSPASAPRVIAPRPPKPAAKEGSCPAPSRWRSPPRGRGINGQTACPLLEGERTYDRHREIDAIDPIAEVSFGPRNLS